MGEMQAQRSNLSLDASSFQGERMTHIPQLPVESLLLAEPGSASVG